MEWYKVLSMKEMTMDCLDIIKPDFYMTFSEEREPQGTCACWKINKCKYFDRDDVYIIKVDPPIIYDDKHEGMLELENVAIATRHVDYSLDKIDQWPVCVYVLRLNNSSCITTNIIENSDAELIKWAELYPSIPTI